MKKLIAITLSAALLLACVLVAPTFASDLEIWDGESVSEPKDTNSDGVKEIGTAAEFAWLGANGGNGSYILTADIYLNDMKVVLSGDTAALTTLSGTAVTDTSSLNKWSYLKAFTGTLDGNGHTVNGLFDDTVKAVGSRRAMFTSGNGATVKNLRVSNVWFEGATYQGTLFAYNSTGGTTCTVDNCYFDGINLVANHDYVQNATYPTSGAVVGYLNNKANLTLSDIAVSDVRIDSDEREGAFLGDAWASGDISVSNSYNATAYPTFGGSTGSTSAYTGTMTSSNLYAATANEGTVAPAATAVSSEMMKGKKAIETMGGLGDNFYTTETYPMQRAFFTSIDPDLNLKLSETVVTVNGIRVANYKETFRTTSPLAATPLTWEAVIKVDTDASNRPGIIVGNYGGTGGSTAGVELRDGGHPSLWISPSKHNFSSVDVRTGEKMHLAITFDPDKDTATCYVNGVAMQTLSVTKDVPALTDVMCIGGDLRSGNTQVLTGVELYSVALYSDTRTADEIAVDAAAMDIDDEALIAAYDLTTPGDMILTDISANNNHLKYSGSRTFEKGTTFTTYDRYVTEEIPSALPMTVEADLKVDPEAPATRLYTIFGNYSVYNSSSAAAETFNFEIRPNGNPYIYLQKPNAVRQTFTFESIDLRREGRCRLAVTVDYENNTLNCYINGALRQTIVHTEDLIVPEINKKFGIGRDIRTEAGNFNLQYTQLYSVAAYSDLRTPEELVADKTVLNDSDKNLIFAYDLSSDSENKLADLSMNKNDLVYSDLTPPPEGGTTIDTTSYYKATKAFASFPKTLEAEIYLPKTYPDTDRGGVIAGNYSGSAKGVVNLEIYTNGNPRLYLVLPSGSVLGGIFDKVDVRVGTWLNLAIAVDTDADTMTCYVDGVAKQTKSLSDFEPYAPSTELMVGTDYRGISATSFAGKLNSLAFYSDTRTAAEILADAEAVDLTDENLLAAYDLSAGYQKDIEDSSANDNDLVNQGTYYLDYTPELKDYAYSFAVVGDTQIIAQNYPNKLANIYDWILSNQENFNIQHVFGMGDITNGDSDAEWATATTQFDKLDGKISYSLVRGNHDGKSKYDTYLGGENSYLAQCDGAFTEGSALNVYKYLTVGKTDYLIFGLDYGFSDEVIAWASEVIEAHPNHNVIITTHAYLYRDGTTLDQGDVCPPATTGGFNNGDHMWDKFISKHENIVLVMSGHDPCAQVVTTQTRGENGNLVTQMLVDPQGLDANSTVGPTGMVTMLYFSEDGKEVQVRTYSTIKEKYYGKVNQYDITVDKVAPLMGDANNDGTVDILDLVTVSNAISGKEVSYNKNTSDLNGDGVIDKLDLAEIRKIIIA